MKILNNEKLNKYTFNNDKIVNIDFESKIKQLPLNNIVNRVDAYEQYIRECDESNKFRLIFNINPICSNVLFNMMSEVTFREGSPLCVSYHDTYTYEPSKNRLMDDYNSYLKRSVIWYERKKLLKDTGYSHEKCGNLEYHCGFDIFNNHLFRKKEFNVVNVANRLYSNVDFNTISDYIRDNTGDIVKFNKMSIDNNDKINQQKQNAHLYTVDNIYNFSESIDNNLIEENGWLGFRNICSLNSVNYSGETINKIINNRKECEFIDMYPDRTLYSFLPKYNRFRTRYEYNWDYCLTYPYKNVYNDIVEYNDGDTTINGLKTKIVDNSIDDEYYTLKTIINNNLINGDIVNVYVIYGDKTYNHITNVKVSDVIDVNTFKIRVEDIENIITDKIIDDIRICKVINSCECKYYLREFRKLPNFKNLNIDVTAGLTEDDIKNGINNGFASNINKLAFARNIYNDRICQIIFNDDIDITNIKDNLGRNVTEIFLTIIKKNVGYKEWYEDKKFGNENVEFSHCFGKITSGLEVCDGFDNDYNIHKLHNVQNGLFNWLFDQPKVLEDDITYDNESFLGDVVEFNTTTLNENTLEDVYHRFNTYQRENFLKDYAEHIVVDELVRDDYDMDGEFSVEERNYGEDGKIEYVGIQPEGYYYKPHYKLTVREYDSEVKIGKHTKMQYTNVTKLNLTTYKFDFSANYYLMVGDIVLLYDKVSKKYYECEVKSVDGQFHNEVTLTLKTLSKININNVVVFKKNPTQNENSVELLDGSGRYVWRDILSTANLMQDNITYDRTFTNGCHYIYDNINFYLRRQDPYGNYGLSYSPDRKTLFNRLTLAGNYKEVEQYDYFYKDNDRLC